MTLTVESPGTSLLLQETLLLEKKQTNFCLYSYGYTQLQNGHKNNCNPNRISSLTSLLLKIGILHSSYRTEPYSGINSCLQVDNNTSMYTP